MTGKSLSVPPTKNAVFWNHLLTLSHQSSLFLFMRGKRHLKANSISWSFRGLHQLALWSSKCTSPTAVDEGSRPGSTGCVLSLRTCSQVILRLPVREHRP
ncbi:hypothetical protein SKAU_G00323400 [Synaphobranchus kaupii]|uniref:Uncharacterized protein n=1 Tax=Synaphobranchus kaupii TaxID=118154 RepID=A0A9Q1EPA3_SYNKA|nr:hypothetical protein SKAU_G00323400 [Synaphobranchus kaupii]